MAHVTTEILWPTLIQLGPATLVASDWSLASASLFPQSLYGIIPEKCAPRGAALATGGYINYHGKLGPTHASHHALRESGLLSL
jgi:hypothetical protein